MKCELRRGLWAGVIMSWLQVAMSAGQDVSPLESAWRHGAGSRWREATEAFAVAEASAGPEARLGRVLAILSTKALTPAQVSVITAELEELATVPGAIGISAGYYLGRLYEYHRLPASLPEAQAAYAAVLVADPQGALAQWISVREALRALYRASAESVAERFTAAESLGARLTDPLARRNLHLQLARAADRMRLGSSVAYRHYLEADRLGLAQAGARGLARLRLGELAAQLGDRAGAAAHLRRFVAEFPRDERTPTARARVAELEGTP